MRIPVLALATAFVATLAVCGSPAAAQQGETPDEMREANRAAALLLSERLKRDRPADYELFCGIRRTNVLVVQGQYDHVEWVLRDLGVPFAVTSPEALSRRSLRGVRAVLVNCPGRVGDAGVRRLREFVDRGGYLFTTDWAVLHILEPGFPGLVRYTRRPTRDDVVSIRVLEPLHLFLMQVLTGRDRHLWWLENQSYPFRILDRRRVEVLIDSEELGRKYGARPVAVTFRHGRGRVVHIISHAYLQRTELRTERDRLAAKAFAGDLGFDEESEAVRRLDGAGLAGVPSGKVRSAYSAQQFLANFLIDAMRGESPESPPEPPPPEPPRPVPPVVRPAPGVPLAAKTRLRDAPEGTPVKLLARGLPVTVLTRRDGWLEVRTPAGETGWIPHSALYP
jgi:hypothetical protein